MISTRRIVAAVGLTVGAKGLAAPMWNADATTETTELSSPAGEPHQITDMAAPAVGLPGAIDQGHRPSGPEPRRAHSGGLLTLPGRGAEHHGTVT